MDFWKELDLRAMSAKEERKLFIEEIESLRQQLAAALAACEAKEAFLQFAWRDVSMSDYAFSYLEDTITIKPDASALKAHDDALIERCAGIVEAPHWKTVVRNELIKRATAIRRLKGTINS